MESENISQVLSLLKGTISQLLENGEGIDRATQSTLEKLCLLEFRDPKFHCLHVVKKIKEVIKEAFEIQVERLASLHLLSSLSTTLKCSCQKDG